MAVQVPSSCATIHLPDYWRVSLRRGPLWIFKAVFVPDVSLRSSTFIWNLFFFRRGVYLTNCTEMLFASFDWFSSSNMYVLQSPMYDSYASNLSVYSVHEHQDQWMARSILNWFFILNFFSAPSVKWRDSVLKYVTDVSFHILANSVFTVIQLLHAV